MSPNTALIVGPGRLGLSLAADLSASGLVERVAIAGHASAPPPFLGDHPAVAYVDPEGATALWADRPGARAGLVLAVGDDSLPAAAAEWAERLVRHPHPGPFVALHTSGFHSADVLEPLRAIDGASVGGWHPLMAIAAPGTGLFEGVTVGIDGEPDAVAWAGEISRALGAHAVEVPAGEKPRYHAAAVFASNYLVACLGVARAELERATGGAVDDSALLPLARAAIENVARRGIADGATGPIVRGDLHTIEGHLEALDPDRAALYRALGRELLELVRGAGSSEAHAALRSALGEE